MSDIVKDLEMDELKARAEAAWEAHKKNLPQEIQDVSAVKNLWLAGFCVGNIEESERIMRLTTELLEETKSSRQLLLQLAYLTTEFTRMNEHLSKTHGLPASPS